MRLTLIAAAFVATLTALPAVATPVRFACASMGEKLIVPPASASSVCERFRVALSRAARVTLRADARRFAAGDAAPWIRVSLQFTKAGVASARVERAQHGRVIVYPASNVAVSDRAIGPQTIDLLARDVARAIDAVDKAG